ncbi:MAG: selenium-binding protein SBP56-related protein [Gemmatimonadota bacterium]|nr:selenium-binding protein SBP56-related protein [Gemmatimonadota bacterium]
MTRTVTVRSPRRRSFFEALALLPLLACAAPATSSDAQAVSPGNTGDEAAPEYLYACVQDDARIAVIDMDGLEVARTIDLTTLGFSSNAKPHHVAVEPGGERWYVSLIGEDLVARFDRGGELQGTFEMSTPGMLSFEPGTGRLLASRSMSATNPPTRVGWIDTRTMDGDEIDVFFPRPHPMTLTPDGRWAYTGSLGVNQIAAIDLETEEVTLTDLDGPPHALVQFAVSADGRWLVGSTEVSGRLLAFDLEDPAHPRQVASVGLGPMAFDPIFTPDGSSVWVPVKGENEIAVVRTADWTVERRITAESFRQPHQVVFSPDGTRAFVSNNGTGGSMEGMTGSGGREDGAGVGNVTVIDTRSFEAIEVLELGRNVTGMGRAPGE